MSVHTSKRRPYGTHLIRIFISYFRVSWHPVRAKTRFLSWHKSVLLRRYVTTTRVAFVFLSFSLNLSSAVKHSFLLHLAQDLKSKLNAIFFLLRVFIARPVRYAILISKHKKQNINNFLYFRREMFYVILLSDKALQGAAILHSDPRSRNLR